MMKYPPIDLVEERLIKGRIDTKIAYGTQLGDAGRINGHWLECTKCGLCSRRENVCIYRGILPARFLFIGGSPGPAEDVAGVPFAGLPGQLIQDCITDAFNILKERSICLSYCMTDTVGCIPLNWSPSGGTIRPPSVEEQRACFERVFDIYLSCKPAVIMTFGRHAEMCAHELHKCYPQHQHITARFQNIATVMNDSPKKVREFRELVTGVLVQQGIKAYSLGLIDKD